MTIYDIAKEANVSASTVSRVINNKPGIKAETRQKVQRLLKKYNYMPNETARGLVNQSSKIIGILVADIRNKHHIDGAYLIEREMTKRGYCCIIFNAGSEEASKAQYIQILEQRRVEGVVFIGSSFQSDFIKAQIEMYLSSIPVIMANGYLDLPNVYGVLVDEGQGVADCVHLLFTKGHRKLAFLFDELTPSTQRKLQGFRQGLAQHGVGKKDEVVLRAAPTIAGGYDATIQLLEQHPDIDGIIYSVDPLAASGCRALMDLGLNIPERIAAIGIDNSIYGELCYPKLTSLDNKVLDQSISCAQILVTLLTGQTCAKKIMLFTDIVERETT